METRGCFIVLHPMQQGGPPMTPMGSYAFGARPRVHPAGASVLGSDEHAPFRNRQAALASPSFHWTAKRKNARAFRDGELLW
jgi:hypothetical protein